MTKTKVKYIKCPNCGSMIAITKQNPIGKCPFRFCKSHEGIVDYNVKLPLNNSLSKKYVGQRVFYNKLDDVMHCIEVTSQNNLVCITLGYPSIHILSELEFRSLLNYGRY